MSPTIKRILRVYLLLLFLVNLLLFLFSLCTGSWGSLFYSMLAMGINYFGYLIFDGHHSILPKKWLCKISNQQWG